ASLYVFDAQHLVLDRPEAVDVQHLPTPTDLPTAYQGSAFPTEPAGLASMFPSLFPSGLPSEFATDMPTYLPSGLPTNFPTDFPTALPSNFPLLDAARWLSSDGGRTWSNVSTAPGTPVTEIPDGAQVVNYNPENDISPPAPG